MTEHFVKAKVKKEVTVNLEISESAAKWLKANVQNPLHGQNYVDESEEDEHYRSLFWEALNNV